VPGVGTLIVHRSALNRIALAVVVLLAATALYVGVVTGSASAGTACGTVTLNEGSWIGSTANVYVVKNVLESKLGCKVKIANYAEIAVYKQLQSGKVDAVLEDWQHVDQYRKYEQQLHVAQDAGWNGIVGHSGWFVPSYVVKAHPELATWQGLQKDWSLFKTPASGNKGQLLVPDPAYVTNDASLIRSLRLNLKVVYAGGETAQIDQIKQAYAKKRPLLFYWYSPQWLNAELSLSEVQLPARTAGCDTDLKKVTCAYPSYDLRKVISTRFAKSGSPALGVIQRFSWTAQDQDAVALMVAEQKLDPNTAARKWIAANPAIVKAWLS
jgi:glycine betaine/proline transport system substrate-binding protein